MRRRTVLAVVPALLAGCERRPPPDATTEPTSPPPETVEECRPTPRPPKDPTPAEAHSYVADHEAALVYNWLVAQHGGPDECRPEGPGSSVSGSGVGGATEITVDPVETAVVADTPAGYYLVSTASGRADYWCADEGRACAGAGRNAHFVTHFVGDGRHRRVPHNWLVCHAREEPYRAPDPDRNLPVPADEPGLTFRVYPFREDATADVTLTDREADERVLRETYSPNVGPAVQSDVTVAAGEYRLVAETDDERAVHEFSLAGREDAAWNGLCVYVGPTGLHVVAVGTEGDLAAPASTCFERRRSDGA